MPHTPFGVPEELMEDITEAIRERTLVPFIGPGVSCQTGHKFPTWRGLIDEMFKIAKEKYLTKSEVKKIQSLLDAGKPLVAAEPLRYRWPKEEYRDFLVNTFNPKSVKPARIHKALFELKPPLILTTNYDLLLEDAYAAEYGKAATVNTYRRMTAVQKALEAGRSLDRPTIFKLHGSISEPSDIILADTDYRDITSMQLGYLSLLSIIFITHSVLLLGFSPSDLELTILLDTLRDSLKYDTTPDYIFLSNKTDPGKIKEFQERYKIKVIPFESSNGEADMYSFVNSLKPRSTTD